MKTYFARFSEQVKKTSDKLMNYFLITYFIVGLRLAMHYNTWGIAIGVGGLSLFAYYFSKFMLKNSNLYQYVLSAVMGIFMAQFIYQMHGLFEMHFFAFISSAILITYRNWKLQIPLAIVVIIHHAVFAYLQFEGFGNVYFTQLDYMSFQTFYMHIALTATIFSVCGLWSYNLKVWGDTHVKQSYELGKLQEISVQKEALLAMSDNLRLSNERLQIANNEIERVFNTVGEVLFSMDVLEFRIKKISVACLNIFGYSQQQFIDSAELWYDLFHPLDREILYKNFEELKEGKTITNKYRMIHKDGDIRWVEFKVTPTLNDESVLVKFDGVCNDITERINLEAKLALAKKEKVQQITEAVITAQENERHILGQELHDNINPTLATAKLFVDCAITDEERRIELMRDCKSLINLAIDEIRKVSRSLVPPSLGEIGLVNAISDLVDNISRVNDLQFSINCDHIDESNLSEKLKLTVFRIIQEQLNNILKHASASMVSIRLLQHNNLLVLNITDDGVGFDTNKKRNGVGLQNIISRAELFNGNVVLNSSPGNGCKLSAKFYIHQNNTSVKTEIRA